MQAVSTLEELLSNPIGKYLRTPRYTAWCWSADLIGVSIHGDPAETDVAALLGFLDRQHHGALASRVDHVFDCRRVGHLDARVFAQFVEGLLARRDVFDQRVRRQALVRPEGLVGAAVAGVSSLVESALPWRTFPTLEAALGWFEGRDAVQLARSLDEALLVMSSAEERLVSELRGVLQRSRFRATLPETAQALGINQRTLQRRLLGMGTSFRELLDRERVICAQRWLRDPELKLEVVAHHVGCASATHFVAVYRQATGITPGAWRRLLREGSAPIMAVA